MKHLQLIFVVLGLSLGAVLPLKAQSYSIDWFSINGGGGTSTGGGYSVSGTIGQPDAGSMSGGNFILDGGFWGIIAAVQTPGSPVLKVTLSNNFVIVSWPDSASGFQLQNNNDLTVTNGWSNVPENFATNGGRVLLTLPSPTGNNFYRLRKP